LKDFYKYSENLLKKKFYYEKEIIKYFSIEPDIKFWKDKSKMNENLSKEIFTNKYKGIKKQELGYSEIKNSGYVDVNLLLEKSEEFFQEKNVLIQEDFEYEKLKVDKELIDYKGIK
jgi:hypothetical protein